MAYALIWSTDASDELVEIIAFQKEKYGTRKATEVYHRIHERIVVTRTLPETGRVVPELAAIGMNEIRELIDSPWRILYQFSVDRVEIVSVIDGRRNFEEVLYRKVMDGKLV